VKHFCCLLVVGLVFCKQGVVKHFCCLLVVGLVFCKKGALVDLCSDLVEKSYELLVKRR